MIGHEREGVRVFAVLDPLHKGNREMIAALGTDAVEVREQWAHGPDCPPVLRVRLRSLPEARVIAVCRLIARRNGIGFEAAYITAVQLGGIAICPAHSYLCEDPEVGRDYYANLGWEAGP